MFPRILTSILLVAFFVTSAPADHHDQLKFLMSFTGKWDAKNEQGTPGTLTFVRGVSGQAMLAQGEFGTNKFDDFITYDPKSKNWLMVGAGEDGARYTHTIKKFPTGTMKAGQKWSAKTDGVSSDGKPETGSLEFVARGPDRYEVTIHETINGEKQPERKIIATRRK